MREIEPIRTARQAHRLALRLASIYVGAAIVWIVASDWVVASLDMSERAMQLLGTAKGFVLVLVTGALLYLFSRRFLTAASVGHVRYQEAQDELRMQERSIEQAYIDVLAAVTGGKLILM